MAISFNQQKGSAQKTSIKSYQYTDGDNKMRLCGDILARYVYWVKGENDKKCQFFTTMGFSELECYEEWILATGTRQFPLPRPWPYSQICFAGWALHLDLDYLPS